MKKTFTLLVALGLLTAAAYAQPPSRDNRDKPQYDQRSPQQNDQRDKPQYDPKKDQQNGQWDNDKSYNNGKDMRDGNDRYNYSNGPSLREMAAKIAQINRKYDQQVQRVKNDFRIRRFEKTRLIRSLDDKRQQEIRMLYARSGNNSNRQYDHGYNSNNHY